MKVRPNLKSRMVLFDPTFIHQVKMWKISVLLLNVINVQNGDVCTVNINCKKTF